MSLNGRLYVYVRAEPLTCYTYLLLRCSLLEAAAVIGEPIDLYTMYNEAAEIEDDYTFHLDQERWKKKDRDVRYF